MYARPPSPGAVIKYAMMVGGTAKATGVGVSECRAEESSLSSDLSAFDVPKKWEMESMSMREFPHDMDEKMIVPTGASAILDETVRNIPGNYLDASMRTVFENPERLERIVGGRLQEGEKKRYFDAVRSLLEDPEIIDKTQKLAQYPYTIDNPSSRNASSIRGLPTEFSPITCATSSHGGWEDLRSKYECCICLDVLACPVVASCEHTFCGACITSHFDSCTVEEEFSSSYEIIHSCPMCREEIEHTIFERAFHRDIAEQIECLKSVQGGEQMFTASFQEWQHRVSMYENYTRGKKKVHAKNEDVEEESDNDSNFLARCFYLAMAVALVAAFAWMKK